MAAFTTMALIGLAAASGIYAGSKLANKGAKNDGGESPHGSIGGPGPTPPTAPPSLALTNSAATATAANAGTKQRKKALAAGTLTNGPGSSQTPAKAKLQPKTLLGY